MRTKDALTVSCLFSSEEPSTKAPLYLINSICSLLDVRVAEVFAIVRNVEKWLGMQRRCNYMRAHIINLDIHAFFFLQSSRSPFKHPRCSKIREETTGSEFQNQRRRCSSKENFATA